MNEFQCIFCGETIKNHKSITSLLITTNWEDEDIQENQQVFCHLKCLKDCCNQPYDIYVEDESDEN